MRCSVLKVICENNFDFCSILRINALCCEKLTKENRTKLSLLVLEILIVEVVHISLHESMCDMNY